jgi:hypothetical protein
MSLSRVALFSTVVAGLAAAGHGSSVLGQGQPASPAGNGPCTPIETREANGKMVRRNCRNVTAAGPGEVRPGCNDRLESSPLVVGLVSCG